MPMNETLLSCIYIYTWIDNNIVIYRSATMLTEINPDIFLEYYCIIRFTNEKKNFTSFLPFMLPYVFSVSIHSVYVP